MLDLEEIDELCEAINLAGGCEDRCPSCGISLDPTGERQGSIDHMPDNNSHEDSPDEQYPSRPHGWGMP